MSYRLLPEDPDIEQAIRRIATSLLTRATTTLSGPAHDAPASVHDVRKSVKKLRGLIRLARPGFRDYATENAALRATGHTLSHLRDADVMRQTLADLADGTAAFPALTAALDAHGAATRDPAATAAATAAAHASLSAIADRVPGWRIRGRGFSTPASALARTHAAAQDALARLNDPPDPDLLHTFRKRAKDALYQYQLVEPIWPSAIGLRVRDTDRLTEHLGQWNDLAVLLARAATTPLPPDEAMHLTTRTGLRQSQLLAKALPIARRLFAGEAGAVSSLYTDLWQIWRAERG